MDGALATPDTPSSPLADPTALAAKNKPYQDALADKANSSQGQLDQIEMERERGISRLEDERGRMMPPKLETVPAPVAKSTNPMHVWGSAAMTLALLGSLMTRQPLRTAFDAATGVLNAYHKGDQEAANAAFQTWKISSDNAMKLFDYQSRVYEKVLADIDRQEGEVDKVAGHRETAVISEVRAYATAMNDEVMGNVRTTSEAIKLEEGRLRAATAYAKSAGDLEELHYGMQAIEYLKKDPAFQALDPVAQAAKVREVLKKTAPSFYDQGVKAANLEAKKITDAMNATSKRIKDEKDAILKKTVIAPTTGPEGERWKRLSAMEITTDKVRAKFKADLAEQAPDIPFDESVLKDLPDPDASGAHNPPPQPPTFDGQTSTNHKTGDVWIGHGGKWTLQNRGK
jgi:hypothetical protein